MSTPIFTKHLALEGEDGSFTSAVTLPEVPLALVAKRPAVQNEDGSFTSAVTLPELATMLGLEYATAKVRVQRGKLPKPAVVMGTMGLWPLEQAEKLAEQEAQKRARAGDESADMAS